MFSIWRMELLTLQLNFESSFTLFCIFGSQYMNGLVYYFLRITPLLTFSNFFRNPTPKKTEILQNIEWPKVRPSSFQYLNINNSLRIESDFKKNTYDKWIKVYNMYGTRPFDTY